MTEQDFYIELGRRLKREREKAGMKQKELASEVGVKPPFVSSIENEGVKVSLYLLRKIAHALKISLDDLVSEKKTTSTASSIRPCLS